MKIAFIGNIHSQCGISTYNENLFASLKLVSDVKFFGEKNGNESNGDITYCWYRNEFPKLNLIDEIDKFKPDIVLFSHEYGIYPKSYYFSCLVSYFRLRGYKVVSIFHSVYEFHVDKLTTESVCKNVVVHTEQAKQCLVRKGINEQNVFVVPHGCSFLNKDKQEISGSLWNHFGNNHVILQPGFLFNYKSHLFMLDIVAELKNIYPDVLYVILASENPKCQDEHDKVYQSIVEKIEKLNLQHNVIIDRGFVSNEVLMSYIRTSSVVVLPYKPNPEFDVFSASGMARLVLQTSTPLITSSANLFNGLETVSIKAIEVKDWVKSISDVFDKKIDQNEVKKSRKEFILNNSWDVAAHALVSYNWK